jgi:hypothetical protein
MTRTTVRRRACPTCPYRRGVPSGIWAPEEYELLKRFDGDIGEQAAAGALHPFLCHSSPRNLCAGWAGHRDPMDLHAVRLGIAADRLDVTCAYYTTDVPLFRSGAEAAAHGLRDIDRPGQAAIRAVRKLLELDPTRLPEG